MTRSEFELFLNIGIALCAVMMILVLFRARSRGSSAYFLSAAFLSLGFLLLGLRESWSQSATAVFGVLVLACLFADFALRSSRREDLS